MVSLPVSRRGWTADRDDEWTEHDTTRENTRRHRRVSRDDVTAARGDVHVNRGRDARNHDDRRTDRTIVRDRFSALLFLSFLPFFFLARIYIHDRGIRKQMGAILLSGSRQRNGPEWRDRGMNGHG